MNNYYQLFIIFLATLIVSACGPQKLEFKTLADGSLSKVERGPDLTEDIVEEIGDGNEENRNDLVDEDPPILENYLCEGGRGVLICHVPPGNASAQHTICIGRPALKAHVGHHTAEDGTTDHLGPCS